MATPKAPTLAPEPPPEVKAPEPAPIRRLVPAGSATHPRVQRLLADLAAAVANGDETTASQLRRDIEALGYLV